MAAPWTVEHRCSQCGAPILLEEANRHFVCPFCRVSICLITKDHFRYYFEPQQKFADEMIYVPYWRIRGVVFSCDESLEVTSSMVDASQCAFHNEDYPEFLGLRPQALKLRFALPESGMVFTEPPSNVHEELTKIETAIPRQRDQGTPLRVFHRSFMSQKVSIVYAPFFIKNRALHDGIIGKPIKSLREMPSYHSTPGAVSHWLKVVPGICPECGGDLEGGRDSVIFLCLQCGKAWRLTEDGLVFQPFSILEGDSGQAVHLPFWRIQADVEGLVLRSRADLVRTANMPIALRQEWESQAFHFWVPAFKVHAPLFLRLARLLTLHQPTPVSAGQDILDSPQPASLSPADAAHCLTVVLASLVAVKKRIWPLLHELSIRPIRSELVYIPFHRQGEEFFNDSLKISVAENSLKYGQYL